MRAVFYSRHSCDNVFRNCIHYPPPFVTISHLCNRNSDTDARSSPLKQFNREAKRTNFSRGLAAVPAVNRYFLSYRCADFIYRPTFRARRVLLDSEVLIFHGRISVLEAIETQQWQRDWTGATGSTLVQLEPSRRELKLGLLLQANSIFSRMEETSRRLLQHKHRAEQLKKEKTALTLSYEVS